MGDRAPAPDPAADLEAVLAKAREVSEREQGGQELMRRPGMTYARYKELA